MRLVTHNYLQSNVRGTTEGYPLQIEATEVLMEECPMDRELLERMVSKIDYDVLVLATKQLSPHCEGGLPELPEKLPEAMDDDLVRKLHRVLFEVHLQEGQLICPSTGRKFPVKEGIPNMVLHEDEV